MKNTKTSFQNLPYIFFFKVKSINHLTMLKKSKDKKTPPQKLYIFLLFRAAKSFHCVEKYVHIFAPN